MPRATNGPPPRKRRKRILLRAKGFRGFRSKLFRYAKDAVYKAWQYEYRDRKEKEGAVPPVSGSPVFPLPCVTAV